jgi:hypothetical protein
MRVSKAYLYQLIRECRREMGLSPLLETGGTDANIGGKATALAASRPPSEPPLENQADAIVQEKALNFFIMNLGLEEKAARVMIGNIAIPDLISVMDKIPKIDTAAEGEDDLYGLHEEKESCFSEKYTTFKGKSKCIQRTKKMDKESANAYVAKVLRDKGEIK